MRVTREMVAAISKVKPPPENIDAFVSGLNAHAAQFGLERPHRLGQFIPQIMHESGGLKHNREIWGPTPAQRRYEGRKDLGNTQPGDGSKFRGYGFIQVTGRANTTEFLRWCREHKLNPPDFVREPALMASDPWSTLSAIWFWHTRQLNRFADIGDTEMITRRINGGLNGFSDRLSYVTRTGLVLLGYGPNDVARFQTDFKLAADGIAGPATRRALHDALLEVGAEVS